MKQSARNEAAKLIEAIAAIIQMQPINIVGMNVSTSGGPGPGGVVTGLSVSAQGGGYGPVTGLSVSAGNVDFGAVERLRASQTETLRNLAKDLRTGGDPSMVKRILTSFVDQATKLGAQDLYEKAIGLLT